ncbi:MAG: FGGY-family carbohydrate kinase [Alphaproteobacteria bacterium]
MARDLVIGIDSSTTATKAIAWSADGVPVAEGRCPIALTNPAPLVYEQDARDWWRSLCSALRDLGQQVDLGRTAAVSIANQRETWVAVDADGEPVRPGVVWVDERGRPDCDLLEQAIGRDRLLAITGKIPGPLPCLYSIHWMKREEPELYRKTARFLDVHGYLVRRLTGEWRTSWSSADPTALLDLQSKRYAPEILAALEIGPDNLAEVRAPGSVLGEVHAAAAEATGLPSGTPVVAGGGDGQAAGLGTGVLGPGRAYLNLGTASVSGVYGDAYATDPAFRTMTSLTGEGYIFELCLITGTFLVNWLVEQLFEEDPAADPDIYRKLEREAAGLPAGSDGLMLMPYWGGVMTPFWDADARGLLIGLSSEHGRGHIYRAMMEGIALDEAMGLEGIERVTGERIDELLTIGGGSKSDLWSRIVANATGKPVKRLATAEASSLGAAITAAVGAGWFADAVAAATAMAGRVEDVIDPEPVEAGRYAELLGIYKRLYPQTRELLNALTAFKEAQRR